jgi:hypothetical protein
MIMTVTGEYMIMTVTGEYMIMTVTGEYMRVRTSLRKTILLEDTLIRALGPDGWAWDIPPGISARVSGSTRADTCSGAGWTGEQVLKFRPIPNFN